MDFWQVSALMRMALSGLTTTAVIIAVIVWWKRINTRSYDDIRTGLLEVRSQLMRLRHQLSRDACREIGTLVAGRLYSIQREGTSRDMIISLLVDQSRRDYVLTAFELGLRDSTVRREVVQRGEEMLSIPFKRMHTIPLLADMLHSLLAFIDSTVKIPLKPEYYERTLLSPEAIEEKLVNRLQSLGRRELHHRELAEIIGEATYELMDNLVGKMLNEAERMLRILVRTFVSLNDVQLDKLRKRCRKRYVELTQHRLHFDTTRGIDRTFDFLAKFGQEISPEDRDAINESRATLNALLSSGVMGRINSQTTILKIRPLEPPSSRGAIEMMEREIHNRKNVDLNNRQPASPPPPPADYEESVNVFIEEDD